MDKSRVYIASGSYGDVYRVNIDGIEYAIKCYDNIADMQEECHILENFGEVGLLLQIDHPNIIKGHSFSVENGKPSILMDLADSDLEGEIRKHNAPISTKIQYMYEILSGLDFFHKNGYAHCDFSLGNILIRNGSALLADLSLVKRIHFENTGYNSRYQSPDIIYDDRPKIFGKRGIIPDIEKLNQDIVNVKLRDTKSKYINSDVYAMGMVFLTLILNVTDLGRVFGPDRDGFSEKAKYQDIYQFEWITFQDISSIARELESMERWPKDSPKGLSNLIARSCACIRSSSACVSAPESPGA